MKRFVWSGALLGLLAASSVYAQEFRRYHFKKPVELRLDTTRLAIRNGAAPTGFVQKAGSFQYPLPEWKLVDSENAKTDAGMVRTSVKAIASRGQVGFVSPVFIDDFGGPTVVTQDILIGVRENIPAVQARAIVARYGAVIEEGVGGLPNGYKVRSHSRSGAEVLEQANELARMDEVEFAEPDMIATTRSDLIPNDPSFGLSWGLRNIGQNGGVPGFDMGATTAWDTTTGSSAIITVVLDDGVQSNHPDLAGRVLTPGFDATGQGGQGEPVSACDNHGTVVAGCIVSRINNSLGTAGVAPSTRVISARKAVPNVPCNGSGTLQFSWFADSLAWAQSIGARVTNNSSSISPTSSLIDAAYASTYNAGMIHFGSAGNDTTGTVSYPANLGVVNGIGALDRFGNRAEFSNWGTGLDFSAPGEEIYTTDRSGTDGYNAGDYRYASGTSYASPYAAGVAALILSKSPGLMPAQVEAIMRGTARDLGTNGYDTDFGYGLVRADAAMRAVNGDCGLTWEEDFEKLGPSARVGYSMAYDAQRAVHVLFGGDAGTGPLSDTWTWNGLAWRLASNTGPSARANAVATYDSARNRIVLFGGRSGSTYLGDTWEWNGTAWTLVSTAASPPSRGTAGMVFDSSRGRSVLFGGYGPSGHLGDLWEYDGISWSQRPIPAVGVREWPGMSFDSARGVVVLFGGSPPAGGSLNDTWEWNGGTGVWSLRDSGVNGPPSRSNKNLAFDSQRGVTVVLSGYAGSSGFRADHWEWNGTVWTQRHIAIPEASYSHVLTYDSVRNRVVTFGGEVATGGIRNTTWEFDSERWIPMAGTGPSARFGSGMTYAEEMGGAAMFGGILSLSSPNPAARSAELYVRSPFSWGRLQSSGPSARAYPSIGRAGPQQLIMFGGLVGVTEVASNEVWSFSEGLWSIYNPSNPPAPRGGAASCVFESNGKFVVFGGSTDANGAKFGTLHLIDADAPLAWENPFVVGPSARDHAMMAYDPIRDEAILFGGRGSGGFDLDDVWRLRFVSGMPQWTAMASLGSIQSWRGGSMFWDPGRQRIVLYAKQQFGFDHNASVKPTVYEWTGTYFVPIAVEQPPSLRRYAMMGPTSESGHIRMFGGLLVADGDTSLGDTWAFNGVAVPDFPLGANGGGSFESGSAVTLQAPMVVGQSPALRWKRDGDPVYDGTTPSGTVISGAQTATLVLSNIRPAEAGVYLCSATNPCGSDESNTVVVEVFTICPADLNGDLLVDDTDFVIFASAYDMLDCADPNMPAGCPADINGDGMVEDLDFVLFASAYDQLICP